MVVEIKVYVKVINNKTSLSVRTNNPDIKILLHPVYNNNNNRQKIHYTYNYKIFTTTYCF